MRPLTPDLVAKSWRAWNLQERIAKTLVAHPTRAVSAAERMRVFDTAVGHRPLDEIIDEQEVLAWMHATDLDRLLNEDPIAVIQKGLATRDPADEASLYELEGVRSAAAMVRLADTSRADYDWLRETTPKHQLAWGMTQVATVLLNTRARLWQATGT
ncbi:MAG TPA: hypothetical protein VK053_15015 [Jiangellaceae bacterium]|nr:hypothetical protein [Jiangellaceae bacterium]